MSDSENIECLVGLLKKVENKQKRQEFEKYKKVAEEIDSELKKNILRFYELSKKLEKKALLEVNRECDKHERESLRIHNKIKEFQVEYKKSNNDYEKSKKLLQVKASKLKEYYIRQLEAIEEEEREELRELKKEMKSLILAAKKEAYLFSRNNINLEKKKIYNVIKNHSKI